MGYCLRFPHHPPAPWPWLVKPFVSSGLWPGSAPLEVGAPVRPQLPWLLRVPRLQRGNLIISLIPLLQVLQSAFVVQLLVCIHLPTPQHKGSVSMCVFKTTLSD